MTKNVRYATEADIESAPLGEKLNFGNHLYLRVGRSEGRVFKFPVCLNGKDTTLTIGKYPGMSLAEARQVASVRQNEVERTRKEHSAEAFQERLRSLKQKKAPRRIGDSVGFANTHNRTRAAGFSSLEDAGKFVLGLNKTKDSVSSELSIWLALKLLIPSRKEYLLRAKWSDLDTDEGVFYFRRVALREDTSISQFKLVAPLSIAAKRKIDDLRRITGKFEDMFPELKKLTSKDLHKLARGLLAQAWPHYFIDPDEFPDFFERIALQHSLVHASIVECMLTNRPGSPSDDNQGTYNFQLRFLAQWWGETLDWFAYRHSGQFWGTSENSARPAQARPQFGII